MLIAYGRDGHRLIRLPTAAGIEGAVWVDLFQPTPAQVELMAAQGISCLLYTSDAADE